MWLAFSKAKPNKQQYRVFIFLGISFFWGLGRFVKPCA